jgi:hypothetical protein
MEERMIDKQEFNERLKTYSDALLANLREDGKWSAVIEAHPGGNLMTINGGKGTPIHAMRLAIAIMTNVACMFTAHGLDDTSDGIMKAAFQASAVTIALEAIRNGEVIDSEAGNWQDD